MERIIACIILCISFSLTPFAQNNPCGFDRKLDLHIEKSPDFLETLNDQERRINLRRDRRNADDPVEIPVVVHVLHLGEPVDQGTNISDAQILSALDQLNNAYAGTAAFSGPDSKIRFSLALRGPNCTFTTGINRVDASKICVQGDCYNQKGMTANNEVTLKSLSRWPSRDYLNIWIVSEINDNDGGQGIQGFAEFPGAAEEVDGVTILFNAFGNDDGINQGFQLKENTRLGTILVHEVGHSLGLYHSFEGDDYNRDGIGDRCPSFTGCGPFNGDCVEDTPPHRRSNGDCNVSGTNVCDGGFSNDLYVHNFMDYSGETCQWEFTAGQVARMRAFLDVERSSWKYSLGGIPPSDHLVKSIDCTPKTKNLKNGFGLGVTSFSLGGFTYLSGTAVQDGGYRDNWCTEIPVERNHSYPIQILTGEKNNQNVAVYMDFNGNGQFDHANELVFSSSNALVHTGMVTIPSSTKSGIPLRVRVISAYPGFQINSPCFEPLVGQVEDYSMVVSPVQNALPKISLVGTTASTIANINWSIDHLDAGEQIILEKVVDQTAERLITISASDGVRSFRDFSYDPGTAVTYNVKVLTNDGKVINQANWSPGEALRLHVYPNPVQSGFVNAVLKGDYSSEVQIEILSLDGVVLSTLQIDRGVNQGAIPISVDHLATGMYMLRVRGEDGSAIKRITIM